MFASIDALLPRGSVLLFFHWLLYHLQSVHVHFEMINALFNGCGDVQEQIPAFHFLFSTLSFPLAFLSGYLFHCSPAAPSAFYSSTVSFPFRVVFLLPHHPKSTPVSATLCIFFEFFLPLLCWAFIPLSPQFFLFIMLLAAPAFSSSLLPQRSFIHCQRALPSLYTARMPHMVFIAFL